MAVELARAKLLVANAALRAVDNLPPARFWDKALIPTLREEYEKTIESVEKEMQELEFDPDAVRDEEMRWTRRHLLLVEKQRIIEAFHEGHLRREPYEKLLADIDARLLKLETEL